MFCGHIYFTEKVNFGNKISKVIYSTLKEGIYMSKKIQLTIATLVIMVMVTIIILTTYHDNTEVIANINQERTEDTTKEAPADPNFADPLKLHYVFEDMSGFKLKQIEKNKKITYYIYEFTNEDDNQEKDVFLDFCKELEKNGYVQVSSSADGAGYIQQYELLYQDLHFMVFTESSPDKIVLSVVDYNEEI